MQPLCGPPTCLARTALAFGANCSNLANALANWVFCDRPGVPRPGVPGPGVPPASPASELPAVELPSRLSSSTPQSSAPGVAPSRFDAIRTGAGSQPPPTRRSSARNSRHRTGRPRSLTRALSPPAQRASGSAVASSPVSTVTVESCEAKARRDPEGLQATPWTQPPPEASTRTVPNLLSRPARGTDSFGASTLGTTAANTRQCPSAQPVARRAPEGCHARLVTEDPWRLRTSFDVHHESSAS